jgi:hypothetical protein
MATCKLYFALILDEMAPTTSNFFAAKDEDMFLKHSGIVWSKASLWDNSLILLPISNNDHLDIFRMHPTVGNQFMLVSFIGKDVEDIADLEHHVQLLTPLIITPLPSDIKPEHYVEHRGPPTKWPLNQWEKTFPTKVLPWQSLVRAQA